MVATPSALYLLCRWFWWPVCLTPPFILLISIDTALTAHSADGALGATFIEVPWFLLLFLCAFVVLIVRFRSPHVTRREKNVAGILGLSPIPMVLLFAYVDTELGWPQRGASRAGVVGAVAVTALWVLLAVWLRRRAWGSPEPPDPSAR